MGEPGPPYGFPRRRPQQSSGWNRSSVVEQLFQVAADSTRSREELMMQRAPGRRPRMPDKAFSLILYASSTVLQDCNESPNSLNSLFSLASVSDSSNAIFSCSSAFLRSVMSRKKTTPPRFSPLLLSRGPPAASIHRGSPPLGERTQISKPLADSPANARLSGNSLVLNNVS